MSKSFKNKQMSDLGTEITKVLPPVSRFSEDSGHSVKKQRVITLLSQLFERFFTLRSENDDD